MSSITPAPSNPNRIQNKVLFFLRPYIDEAVSSVSVDAEAWALSTKDTVCFGKHKLANINLSPWKILQSNKHWPVLFLLEVNINLCECGLYKTRWFQIWPAFKATQNWYIKQKYSVSYSCAVKEENPFHVP